MHPHRRVRFRSRRAAARLAAEFRSPASQGLRAGAMNAVNVLLIGLLLGIKHAMDADHLVAVATLVTRQQSLAQSMRQGIAWGMGHSVTLLVVGGIVLALGAPIPHRIVFALELAVGGILIALGADVL